MIVPFAACLLTPLDRSFSNALIKQLVTSKIEHEAAEAKMLRDHEDLENELIKCVCY
jgi:hypothetical protein